MSQIATLHVVPESSVAAVRAAVEPVKAGWFAKRKDVFWDTLHAIAPDSLDLDWSGYAVVLLLEFLREERGFDLAGIEEHPLAKFLSESRSSYFAVFDADVASAFTQRLAAANLSEPELARFANEFTGTDEEDAGKPLLGAAGSLVPALALVKAGTLGLLHVG